MLSRIFWFFFGLAVVNFAVAIPQTLAKWNSPRAVTASPSVDCPAWPNPNDKISFTPKNCVRYRDVLVNGDLAEIWKEKDVLKSEGQTQLWLDTIVGRTKEVVGFYGKNLKTNYKQDLRINITMIRSDKSFGDYEGANALTTSADNGRHCHIIIKIYPAKNPIWVAHYVAHELYHCVENQEHPTARDDVEFIWVTEGSANFFEYLQYPANPTLAVDNIAPRFYDPGVPLYKQNYTSCLFFHFLYNSNWSLQKIDTWVKTADMERDALAKDGEIADAFGEFAKKFYNKKIYIDAKKSFRIHADIPVPAQALETISIPTEGVTVPFKFGAITSWTFKKYSVRLQSKQTVSTTIEWTKPISPNVVVWSRVLRDGKSPTVWAKKLPKVHSSCKGAATYEFLVVPITKEDAVKGQLNFKREQDEACSCPVKKSAGSIAIKREPAIAHTNLDPIIARQQGNHSGSCTAGLNNPSSGMASSSTHTMNIAEVIQSIMGGDPSQIAAVTTVRETNCDQVTSATGTGTYIGTVIRMSDAKLTPLYTQKTLTPLSPILPTAASSRISESNNQGETSSPVPLSQVIEQLYTLLPTTNQEPATMSQISATPTTTSPSNTPTPTTDEEGTEDGEAWDSTWPNLETSSSDDDPADPIDDDNEDEGGFCGQCLVGTWNADKASMEEHSKKPYFRFIPTQYDSKSVKFSTTYKLVFQERPAGEGTDDEKLVSLHLHEELVEEENINAKVPNSMPNRQTMRTVSTSIWDNLVSGFKKQITSSEGNYESGSVYRPITPTTKGDIQIAFDGGPLEPSTLQTYGKLYAPLGIGFSYNCTGDTLTYESNSGGRNYVFQRD